MQNQAFKIYNASAGSGKTFTLVKEYIKILFEYDQDDAFRYILSMTFTNKAVHEMKSRIIRSLSDFSQTETPKRSIDLLEIIAKETGKTEAWIKAKSTRILKKMIHNYSSFDISTIDKFTHKVIRSFATDLELPISFEVSLDTNILLQEAVESLIARVGTDQLLTQVLLEFSLQKAEDDKTWDISRELIEMGQLLTKENDAQELELLKDYTLADFFKLKQTLRDSAKNTGEQIKQLAQGIFKFIEEQGIEHSSFSGQYFPKHIAKIANGEAIDLTKAAYNLPEKIKAKSKTKDEEKIQSLAEVFASMTDEIYKLLGKKAFYDAFLQNITPLSLLREIHQEMRKIQREQNLLSIAEFNKIIHDELKKQPAPFIYERLGEKYRHFFIDEFQDTSVMQWQNLIPLIDNALSGENESGKAGSLMIVGDPKQSIYRWRGGKAEQFIDLSKVENPFTNPSKATLNLAVNFRSYSRVIETNNQFFAFISEKFTHPDYLDLYLNQSFQQINSKQGGMVSFTLFNKIAKDEGVHKHDLYVQRTHEIIKEVLEQGYDYSDIVVLTRKRFEGVLIANYLTENQVPIISSETLLLQNSDYVQLLVSFLKLMKNPYDLENRALVLYFLSKQFYQEENQHDFIQKGIKDENGILSETQFEKYLETVDVKFSMAYAKSLAIYESVEYIIQKLIPTLRTDAYVQYFLDVVLERSVKYQNSLSDFIDFWQLKSKDLSIPAPERSNAVQLMTIHKSKGLEFPIVIYPFAEEDLSRSRDKVWIPIDQPDIELPIALVNFKKEIQTYSQLVQTIYDQKKQEELLDLINVIYVAFTRASEQLYVLSYKNSSTAGVDANNLSTFFKQFIENYHNYEENVEEYVFGEKKRCSHKNSSISESIPIQDVSKLFERDNIKIATREGMMWDNAKAQSISIGNITHEILSQIKTKEDIEDAIYRAIFTGLIAESEKEEYYEKVDSIVKHPELQIFFSNQGRVLSEMPLLKKNTNTLKPDRIVLIENKAYLLDYKTGEVHNKYEKQLETYADALEEMGYTVVKKLLVYIQQDDLKIIHL